MKALVYEGPREMRMRGVSAPVPGRGEVLIRVAYSGICGSELSGYLGRNALRNPPRSSATSSRAGSSAWGSVVFVGLHEPDSELPVNALVRDEIRCIGCFAYTPDDFRTALRWVGGGSAGLEHGVVLSTLEDGAEWFERLVEDPGGVTKVLLRP